MKFGIEVTFIMKNVEFLFLAELENFEDIQSMYTGQNNFKMWKKLDFCVNRIIWWQKLSDRLTAFVSAVYTVLYCSITKATALPNSSFINPKSWPFY